MTRNDYFYVMIVLSDNNAETFNANVIKLIEAIIYYNKNEKMDINSIIKKAKDVFGIEFSNREIINAIKRKGKRLIIENSDDAELTLYRLRPDVYQKIDAISKENKIDNLFACFIKSNNKTDISIEYCRDLVMKYLHYLFCEDVKMIRALLNKDNGGLYLEKIDFSNNEKNLINEFLNWNDSKKDQFVCNAVTCGLDYCMLGLKKDNTLLRNVFKGKVFYFDTNIIFRLMGVNKEKRKNSIEAFVNKCKAANITIKCTNITLGEIYKTIEHRTYQIKKIFQDKQPLNIAAIKSLDPIYPNLDFINEYINWTNKSTNKAGDYEGFIKYLKFKAHAIVNEFSLESFSSYNKGDTKNEFSSLEQSLYEFKSYKHKDVSKETVSVDIENYMLVLKKYSSKNRLNITDANYYIITADHLFTDWASAQMTNVIPIVMLPSVWYSILLKFHGRTNDDYKAFSSFLNFRLSSGEYDNNKTDEILSLVAEMDEPNEIKNKIIFEISNNIIEYRKQQKDTKEIVEITSKSVLEKIVKEKIDENNMMWTGKYDNDLGEQRFAFEKEKYENKEKIILMIKNEAFGEVKFKYYFRKMVYYILNLVPIIASCILLYISLNFTDNNIIRTLSFLCPNVFYIYDRTKGAEFMNRLRRWSDKENIINEYVSRKCKIYGLNED